MLAKINGLDLTSIIGYEVTHKDITKEVTAGGYTTVYVIGKTVEIKIDLAAFTSLAPVVAAMSSVTFPLQFVDLDGIVKEGAFKRNDRSVPLERFINNMPEWGEYTLTLTSLGGVSVVTS